MRALPANATPQHIYADNMVWLWWVAVVFWAVYGLAFITHKFD